MRKSINKTRHISHAARFLFLKLFFVFLFLLNGLAVSQTIDSLKTPVLLHTLPVNTVNPVYKKGDSLSLPHIKKPEFNKDSLSIKKNLKSVKSAGDDNKKMSVHGNISNQYDYGIIPYYMANNSFPGSLFKSTGNLKVRIGKLPLLVDYFYATPKFLTGLNNYFTIRFDVSEYENSINKAKQNQISEIKGRIDSLSKGKQLLYQQMALIEAKKSGMLKMPGVPDLPQVPVIETNTLNVPNNADSLVRDSVTKYLSHNDSLNAIYNSIDTSIGTVNKLKTMYEQLAGMESKLNKDLKLLENPASGEQLKNIKDGDKYTGFFTGVKKFEAGLCYPTYSTFMLSQVALKGINLNYGREKYFVNTSVGKTVVGYSVQPGNSSILNQVQNLTSLVDWKLNQNEKQVAALQAGLGKEDGSYIAIGGLAGRGSKGLNGSDVLANYVFEVKARYVYKTFGAEGAFAKSYVKDNNPGVISTEFTGSQSALGWNNAYLGKLFGTIPKVNTKLQLQVRTIEPFFRSYGMSFTRADVVRTEFKAEQPIEKKIKLSFGYRRDEDNLKSLYSIKTILENYSYGARVKLFRKRLEIALNYNDIYQSINDKVTAIGKNIHSDVKTVVVSYVPRTKKISSTNTFLYSIYQLNDGNVKNQLENFTFSSYNGIKKVRVNITNTYIRNTITDSLNFNNLVNNNLELNYQIGKSLSIGAGGKHAYNIDSGDNQYGYNATITYNVSKFASVEVKGEKLVIGDFFNSLNYQKINDNPYYGYAKLLLFF